MSQLSSCTYLYLPNYLHTLSIYPVNQFLSSFLSFLLPPVDPILSPGVSSSASRLNIVALMSLGGLVDIPGWGPHPYIALEI